MNEYVGNLHVHSTYSDGTGTIEEIAGEAEKAGIDFVGVTDHDSLAGLKEGKEGWHGKVLVLIGMEIGTDHNHYLAWRINREVPDNQKSPQSVIDGVKAQGGIGFIAHPFETACGFGDSCRAFTWEDWGVSGFTGICIWNFMSQWKGRVTDWPRALYYYVRRRSAVTGPDIQTLKAWDGFLAKGKVVAVGGSDAHQILFGMGPFRRRIFPYRYLFNTINTHILSDKPLTGDTKSDRKIIYTALEKGRCFVAYDLLASGRGFEFTGSTASQSVVMGDEINLSGGVRLKIKVPRASHIRVIRDGVLWREGYGALHIYTAKKAGVYRVEALKKTLAGRLRPWIFSNPIYVRH